MFMFWGDNSTTATEGINKEPGSPRPSSPKSTADECQNQYFVQGLTEEENDLIMRLASPENNQGHLFDVWEKFHPTAKRLITKNLREIDLSIPGEGGIEAYLERAKLLLQKSQMGINPFDGWIPSVPTGAAYDFGTQEYRDMEKTGISDLPRMGFVLVAGGLGERLGYSDGIKLQLPVELATETCYLQYYIEYILSIQEKYCKRFTQLPLCIMVSKETMDPTIKLLRDNACFGMNENQIYMIQQGIGVPALVDNDARLTVDEMQTSLVTKPHGHGDIHNLLYKSGVAKQWMEKYNTKWMVFFQDTNGLAFHTLPLMIGVSKKYNLLMNSLAVPRKAKQAIGGIAKLTNKETGEVMTLNVEYNQLDPLLRATEEYPDGDVNDPDTGFSPFPGNINQLLFNCKDYVKVLERTQGIMPEFVNPKYDETDETKSKFKKPTRLECMMQDFPKVLVGAETKRVGFTGVASDMCFSPVKNSNAAGMKIQEEDSGPPGTVANGEANQYAAFRKMCLVRGIQLEEAKEEVWDGIKVTPGPQIVFKPSFITCPSEMKSKFPYPDQIKITSRSSLVVHGSGVVIESLDLDGALVIEPKKPDDRITVKHCLVRNQGWVRQPVKSLTDMKIEMEEKNRKKQEALEEKERKREEERKQEEKEERKKKRKERKMAEAKAAEIAANTTIAPDGREIVHVDPVREMHDMAYAAETAVIDAGVAAIKGAGKLKEHAAEQAAEAAEAGMEVVAATKDAAEMAVLFEKMRGYKLVKRGTMVIDEQQSDCVIL